MKIKPYSEINKQEWDKFVLRSPDAWLYHTSGYLDFALEDGAEGLSFALMTKTNEIQAICPLYWIKGAHLSSSVHFRFIQRSMRFFCRNLRLPIIPWSLNILSTGYSGIAIKGGVNRRNRRKNVRDVIKQVDLIANKKHADIFEVRNVDMVESNEDCILLSTTLLGGGMHEPAYTPNRLFSRIDLYKDEKEIWSGVDEDCRAEINRARRENVVFEADPENAFDRFYSIHCKSWDRTMGLHNPKVHFTNMMKFFGKSIHYFIATYEGKDVAAIMLHCYKDAVFYYSAGSLLEGQKVKGNNFLLYNSILWTKTNGYRWFGVGIFDAICGSNAKEYKVGQYKAQFSAMHFPVAEFNRYYTKRGLNNSKYDKLALIKKINH